MSLTRRRLLGGLAAGALSPAAMVASDADRSGDAQSAHAEATTPIDHASMPLRVASPSGSLVLVVSLIAGRLRYSVSLGERSVIEPSLLGLKMDGSARLDAAFALGGASLATHRGSWNPVCGDRSICPDNYNALNVEVMETIAPGRRLRVEFRVYDEGLAFRYALRAQAGLSDFVIGDESTEFRLADGAVGWSTATAQGVYKKVPVRDLDAVSERPFLLHLANGLWAAIAEAAVENYPSMFLTAVRAERHSLAARLMGPATCKAPFTSPWRVVLVGERAADLLQHNYLLGNLCPPSRVHDTAWIKPGKVMREVTLSTRGGRELVDFAASQQIDFIEYDAGWYGDQDDEASDATKVNVQASSARSGTEYAGLDLREVIAYARSRNIGVILYINRRAMERQLDAALKTYAAWGVAGVKYGFVNVHTQPWTRLLYEAIRKAGEARIMLDIHDEFRPTGMSRTWPHLLTQEGIRGNEEFPDATLNTVLPFTRGLAGAADYTWCWMDPRLKNTWCHQMAFAVIMFSPWQFVFWYDRPASLAAESIGMEWWRALPTVWAETKVLSGEPEGHVAIARRHGDTWFAGAITNNNPGTVLVPLDMLEADRAYTAWTYADGDGPRDVRKTAATVRRGDVLTLNLQARGGAAIMIFPG